VRPGDVVLFHARKPDIMSRLIHLTTRSKWNHAALVVGPDQLIEATAKGVTRASISGKGDELAFISVRYDDEEDRWDAVAWAVAYEGTRYGYLNAFMCGLNNVLAGVNLAIRKTDSVICSELVATALSQAGINVKRDPSQVSPGDLATHFGVPR
jgi:uncharacterized protein YycO